MAPSKAGEHALYEDLVTSSDSTTSAAITAGRFVKKVAGGLAQCGDGEVFVGIADEDSPTGSTKRISYSTVESLVIPVVASGALADGAEIASDSDGKAKAATSNDFIGGYLDQAAAKADVLRRMRCQSVGFKA